MSSVEERAIASGELAVAVGELIQNFGYIEWCTYEWIRVLLRDETAWKAFRRKRISDRIKVVKGLLDEAPISDELRKVAHDLWDAVGPQADVRNWVAHGPFVGVDLPEYGEKMGILNFKPSDESKDYELLTLEGIQTARDAAADVLTRLRGALLAVSWRVSQGTVPSIAQDGQ